MRSISIFFLLAVIVGSAIAQSNLQKLVDTENAFAVMAAAKGTRAAFLEFLSDDSIVFSPQRSNGRQVWMARKESPSLLSWYPAFADISANGLIGYTTGPWEFRPNGKDDTPTAFGHYMTIWQKQPDGNFRAVLDLGVSHDRPQILESKLTSVQPSSSRDPEIKSYAGDTAAMFFQMISDSGPVKAYKEFAADDIRLMRRDKQPFVGRTAAIKEVASVNASLSVSKRTAFFGTDDIAYTTNTYSLKKNGQAIETGNFVQIWKNRGGKWLIVMDIFVADAK